MMRRSGRHAPMKGQLVEQPAARRDYARRRHFRACAAASVPSVKAVRRQAIQTTCYAGSAETRVTTPHDERRRLKPREPPLLRPMFCPHLRNPTAEQGFRSGSIADWNFLRRASRWGPSVIKQSCWRPVWRRPRRCVELGVTLLTPSTRWYSQTGRQGRQVKPK